MITIDGHSGAGTTTAAQRVAAELGYKMFSAGNHLRTFGLAALQHGLIKDNQANPKSCTELLGKISITTDGQGGFWLDGQDVNHLIHQSDTTAAVQVVAAIPEVRAWHDACMINYARENDNKVVFEGRLTGFVFPKAKHFWLEVDPKVADERVSTGRGRHIADLSRERDERDRKRTVAPVRPTPDAIIIDTSHIDVDTAVASVLSQLDKLAYK